MTVERMIKQRNMRLVALAVVCCLVLGQDGGSSGAVLPQYDSTQRTQETGKLQYKWKCRSVFTFFHLLSDLLLNQGESKSSETDVMISQTSNVQN